MGANTNRRVLRVTRPSEQAGVRRVSNPGASPASERPGSHRERRFSHADRRKLSPDRCRVPEAASSFPCHPAGTRLYEAEDTKPMVNGQWSMVVNGQWLV